MLKEKKLLASHKEVTKTHFLLVKFLKNVMLLFGTSSLITINNTEQGRNEK